MRKYNGTLEVLRKIIYRTCENICNVRNIWICPFLLSRNVKKISMRRGLQVWRKHLISVSLVKCILLADLHQLIFIKMDVKLEPWKKVPVYYVVLLFQRNRYQFCLRYWHTSQKHRLYWKNPIWSLLDSVTIFRGIAEFQ